jgi:hypothetical protein
MRNAVAVMLRQPVHKLPLRWEDEAIEDWFYRLEKDFNVRFRFLDQQHEWDPPPAGVWVAIVPSAKEDSDATHAVPMLGRTMLRDAEFYWGRAYELVICGIALEDQ